MQRFTIHALALIILTSAATMAQAQNVTSRGTAGVYREGGSRGSNVGRNDSTRAESAKEKAKRERKKKSDDAAKRAKDAQDALDNHTDRMRKDNDARGQAEYVPGWVRYNEGRRVDETYNRLLGKRDATARAARTARQAYDDAP
jgi:hypothetical protein